MIDDSVNGVPHVTTRKTRRQASWRCRVVQLIAAAVSVEIAIAIRPRRILLQSFLSAVSLLVIAAGCEKQDAPTPTGPSIGPIATRETPATPKKAAAIDEDSRKSTTAATNSAAATEKPSAVGERIPERTPDAPAGATQAGYPPSSGPRPDEHAAKNTTVDDETAKNIAAAAKLTSFLEQKLLFFPAPYPVGNWQPPGLEFEDAHFRAADGTKLHGWYVPHKQARAVVLFAHGNGGNLSHRADILRTLHERMRVAAMIFDYRGYGRSEGSPDGAGVLADARAARVWLANRVGMKENQIVLMGESLGGGVVVDLAAADSARGLVLDSTFSSLPDVAAWHYPWLPADQLMQTRLDSAATIGRYHGPLIEFHGDRDQTVPIQFGRRLFAAANEPKQFVVLPGNDHNDPHPESFFRALDEFFGKLDGQQEKP